MKVLVTGAGALLGQGIIRSLLRCGSTYEVIAADPDARAAGLYWAQKKALVPMQSDPAYPDVVFTLLNRLKPAAVLIGTDVELSFWSENAALIEREYGAVVIVSSPDLIRIANDKWLTNQYLSNRLLPCPRSALVGDAHHLSEEIGFPLIVKPRVGARSQGVHLVYTVDELEHALRAVPNAVVQEHVGTPEDEYTAGALCTPVGSGVVTMRRDLRDGNTYRAYVCPHSDADPFLAELALEMGAKGPINFQFRLVNGIPYIFEINARFSGTTPIRAAAGFNEVHYAIQAFVNHVPVPPPNTRPITVLRYWDELVLDAGDAIPQ